MGADQVFRARIGTALALFLLAFGPERATAQRGPQFEIQPGLAVSDFFSVPEGTATNSAFSFRFTTRFPTGINWLTPVVGAVFLPYGTTLNTTRNTDAPTIFAGNIFPVLSRSRTSGWFSAEIPLVIAHSPGTGPSGNLSDYGRDLVVLPTVYLHLGDRALRELGTIWSKLNLFFQLEQNLTPNPDADGKRDFLNPIATIGVSVTIGAPSNSSR